MAARSTKTSGKTPARQRLGAPRDGPCDESLRTTSTNTRSVCSASARRTSHAGTHKGQRRRGTLATDGVWNCANVPTAPYVSHRGTFAAHGSRPRGYVHLFVMARSEKIVISGARAHDLKGIDLELPRDALIVDHRPLGFGQIGLAFDTLYAGAAPLRRIAVVIRPPVPRPDGEAGRRLDRGPLAGDLDRPEDHLAQPALDRRNGHRDLRLPAPAWPDR